MEEHLVHFIFFLLPVFIFLVFRFRPLLNMRMILGCIVLLLFLLHSFEGLHMAHQVVDHTATTHICCIAPTPFITDEVHFDQPYIENGDYYRYSVVSFQYVDFELGHNKSPPLS